MKVLKEDSTEAVRRVEAWWNHEIIDRAAVRVIAPRGVYPEKEYVGDLERYFTDPDLVIPRLEETLARWYFGGEAFPMGLPISTVAILGSFLGCRVRFTGTGTIWSDPIIDDPRDLPNLDFNPENKWWKAAKHLMECFAQRADGYHVAHPDLNGPTEALARLRGTQRLALDFVDNPDYIKPAIDRITQAWFRYWEESVKIVQKTGGYFHWMGIWSDLPSVDLQSDFSCMISPEMFNEHFLPSIEAQTRMVERTMYHLDGPGAIKHLDALLALPHLDGIQWVRGSGAKPIEHWIPLLRRIQNAGKLVFTDCGRTSVERLLEELRPEGLLLHVSCDSVDEARDLLRRVEGWTRPRK